MIGFVFPGQNSQYVGMGKDFVDAYPVAQSIFQQADDILGFKLSELCFDGLEDELNDTINTQPAVYVCSVAILRVLQQVYPAIQPATVAGHSMGEFTALTAAGSLAFEDGLRLVRERGRLMKEAGGRYPGAMAALLAVDVDTAQSICEDAATTTGRPVVLANDNCPGQIVISGDVHALEKAMELATTAGAKKVIRLNVSIAAHSPLMSDAAESFRRLLDETEFDKPQVPVYANSTASRIESEQQIREVLGGQLTSPVRWTESVQAMIDGGVTRFIEVGPGDVLTGLIKRIDRKVDRDALGTVNALNQLES